MAQAGCRPLVLDSAGRRVFALASGGDGNGILVCPAFAEEMNRARQTVRLLFGEALRRRIAAICPDLHGTGDSDGDFGDARWEHWIHDLETAGTWLRDQGCAAITLLGVRAGALLAWEVLRRGRLPVDRLVLWQPTLTGKAWVTDMLRTRIAGAGPNAPRETVSGLRQRLSAGEPVEAAGYLLAPELVAALDGAAITADARPNLPPVVWIEVVGDEDSAARPPAVDMAGRLAAAGIRVEQIRQVDPPFWSTLEITIGRGTVAATVGRLAEAA